LGINNQRIVIIDESKFKRSKKIDWNVVEERLKSYIGCYAEILDTKETVFIGNDFPDEFAHSKDTKVLCGPNEYAKANASSVILELIQVATNKYYSENHKEKHKTKAKFGWYRYDVRFAVPKYNNVGEGADKEKRVAWAKQLTKKDAAKITLAEVFKETDWIR